tara:strand:+ start:423 stop:752 length:330 start_codon:yes stop_codon:yes gene_type:complete
VQQKFAEAIKSYKKDVFRVEHDPSELEKLTEESLHFTEDALDNAYHYHFHKLPDASRAEIINMVNNYVLEALLPPVVEKLTRRQLVTERKLELLVHLLEEALERLDDKN